MYCLGLRTRVSDTLLHVRLQFLSGKLSICTAMTMIRRTWTLWSVFTTILSIITVVSSYFEHSGTGQTSDDNQAAYHEVIDTLLELLPTPRYFSSILICV